MASKALSPRVRIAPSPTGSVHVGTARTGLFNWLFAQANGGALVLRIEDTDDQRNRDEWSTGIIEALAWLGISYDEGPYFQSTYRAEHQAAADALLSAGYLYACDCSREDIDARSGTKNSSGYDGFCRDRHLERSSVTALRFRVPRGGETIVHDLIRGDVTFLHDDLDDFVVAKPDGSVLFALANLVDDRAMGITHVIRGEDLLPTTPRQILMWTALNSSEGGGDVALPAFAHLPLLVNAERKKLSKRRDPVSIELYREEGYLPETMVNYLALLGWSPRDGDEIVPLSTLVDQFRLEDVSHSPAFFDVQKLRHMNGEYVRALSLADFVERSQPWVQPWAASWQPREGANWTKEQFRLDAYEAIAPLVQERVALLSEIPAMVDFLFLDSVDFNEAAFEKTIRNDPVGRAMLESCLATFGDTKWQSDALHEQVLALGEKLSLPLRKAQAPLRCAVTGKSVGPPLFESLVILGHDVVDRRIRAALERAHA